jgi:hypothetical protein
VLSPLDDLDLTGDRLRDYYRRMLLLGRRRRALIGDLRLDEDH